MAWSGKFNDMFLENDESSSAWNQRQSHHKMPAQKNVNTNTPSVIQNLQQGITISLVGVILMRESPRSVFTKKTPTKERYCISLTLRDSVDWFINATCWGEKAMINSISESFKIGEVVEINNAMVMSANSFDEKFKPWSPSPFTLNLSEFGNITLYTGLDRDKYLAYSHLPIKPASDYYTLEDVNINGQALHGEYVNLLVAVKKLGEVKDITTKTGKQLKRCELKVFDETSPLLALILWEEQIINAAVTWIPYQTVLFINDVRITFDEFRNNMISTATSRTVITVNPDIMEAQHLYHFAQLGQNENGVPTENNEIDPNISEISDVFTVKQLKESMSSMTTSVQYGITYGFISWFDVDSEYKHFIRLRCADCLTPLNDNSPMCVNTNCTSASEFNMKPPVTEYSIGTAISDYTDTLRGCFLSNSTAESLLHTNPEQFPFLSITKKTQLKWEVLFEKFKIYFKIKKQGFGKRPYQIRIIHCLPISAQDLNNHFQQQLKDLHLTL